MDATCKICGNPTGVAGAEAADAGCAGCLKRDQRRRLIFDVSGTPGQKRPTPLESALSDLTSPHEETRMLDLRDLMRRTQESLASAKAAEEDAPLSVREAALLVDSLAPASFDPAVAPAEAARPEAPDVHVASIAPTPPRRRGRALYPALGVLLVMIGVVAAKVKLGREDASAAGRAAERAAPAALPLPARDEERLSASEASAEPSPAPAPVTTTAPSTAPRKAPVRGAPPPPRPRAPAPMDTETNRASAAPDPPTHDELLEAMHAAVAAHAAPSSAPSSAGKGDCPPTASGGSGLPPSPCVRGGTRTSPPRP